MTMARYPLAALMVLLSAWAVLAQEDAGNDAPQTEAVPGQAGAPGDTAPADAPNGTTDDTGGGAGATPPQGEDTAADTAGEDDNLDDPADADLDEQVYKEDEDDFTPSEEIPADEAIPFPTNI
jgi:hypothetical protein